MSLFTSLYTGVNGMNAQSKATGTISTNIANMTTVGFKKSDTVFHDLVVNNTRPAKFANGGVLTTQVQRIDRQGGMQQTGVATELAISGDGFFAVKAADDDAIPFLYTRNGTFSPDNEGVMRNAAGFILYGWPIDENGNVAAGTTTDSLEAVDVNELDAIFRTTTQAELSLNLNAAQQEINPQVTGLPLPADDQAAHFARNLTVIDDGGTPRQLIFEYRKIVGPMAYATAQTPDLTHLDSLTDPAVFGGINAGDTFTIDAGGASQEYIVGAPAGAGQVRIDTIGDLTNHINTTLGGGTALEASIDADGRLIFRMTDPTANLTFTEQVGTPLSGGAGTFNLPGLNFAPTVPLNGGATYPGQGDLPAFANTTDPNSHGWWELTVRTENPLDPVVTQGLLNFNSNGSLNAAPGAGIALNNIDFGGGTASIAVDLTATQFSGTYNVIVADQNGAEAGTLIGVQVTPEGRVVASFTNGEQFDIYQIPLATFVNPNGLQAMTGTVFAQTQDAGELTMLAAGTGGAGILQAETVETSNVDLADEFANLIVSQRAFSANSRVVNTVDEMTQQLRQLKS